MTRYSLRVRAANLAIILLFPILFLEIASLTRRLAPGNPFYAALETLGNNPQTSSLTTVFTVATLLGPVLAIALCLFATIRLEWRRADGAFGVTLHVRDRWLPLATIVLSLGTLGLLFLYAFFENFVPR